MFKRSRFFTSAMLVAVLFASLFIFSNPSRACPAPPPETLLALYLKSDLIVVAEIAAEKDGKITGDYESAFNVEVHRSLKVSAALKGKPPADFVYTRQEYRRKNEPAVESEPEPEGEETINFGFYGYKGYSELRKGERYLFFFTKNSDTGEYDLTDHVSGARKLNDYDLGVHKKRLKELQSIEKMKNDQMPALTAWLIRCIEEPSTRWDGLFTLNGSFASLEYSDEEAPEDGEKAKAEIRFDADFDSNSPELAKNLTDSQKEYLSSLAFSQLQQTRSFAANEFVYYSLNGLVRRWDKPRLAMYSFGILQSVDKSDLKKTTKAMTYIADLLEDTELSEIAERFSTADSPADAETEDPGDTEPAQTVINSEEAPQTIEDKSETPVLTEPKKPTPAEIRETLLQDFIDRYQFLVANGFEVPEEPEEPEEPEVLDK
jgi:hypothetical protein